MKRSLTLAVGVGIFMTASALGISDSRSIAPETSADAADFGSIQVEQLTPEQRAMLQAKYRYWSSSNQVAASVPR